MGRDEQEARKQVIRRLRQVLDQSEVSQTQLARLLGQAHSSVSDWFTKNALPSGETLVRLFRLPEFRHVSAEWLLTGEGSQLKTRDIPSQRAYNLGGIAALTQATEECERLKQLWLSAQQGAGESRAPGAGATAARRAAEAADEVQATRSRRRKRA